MIPVDVKLEWYELSLAAMIGARREIEALRKGSRPAHGAGEDKRWLNHIEGAAGEMAFAKAVNRFYNGSVNTYSTGGDVGPVQVRTRSRHEYELIIRSSDDDNSIFALVTGQSPRFKVWGWIRALNAKRPEWLKDHGNREPAYFVPNHALNALPMRTK
jgi:hypothetical protein